MDARTITLDEDTAASVLVLLRYAVKEIVMHVGIETSSDVIAFVDELLDKYEEAFP